jgi:hypothetical protein
MKTSCQFNAPAALLRGTQSRYSLDRRQGEPHNRSGRWGDEKNLFPLQGIERGFLGRPVRSSVAIQIEPSRLLHWCYGQTQPHVLLVLVFLMKLANIYTRQHKRKQNKHTKAKPKNVQLTATHLLLNVKIIYDQCYYEFINQLPEICFQCQNYTYDNTRIHCSSPHVSRIVCTVVHIYRWKL